ncbi:FAD dependent oxidoreductase [Xylariaceae sp. FL0255]|nr:FAD dependent oxidoreductase [Xylariaceae sp. FL0255]
MTVTPFPVPDATVPFWRTELHELDSHRSTATLPDKQDIVIIGAGFAGASLAYYLLKDIPESKPKSAITILEAREACSGATGRNGGHLRPALFTGVVTNMKTHGLDAANEMMQFEMDNADVLKKLIEEERIDCDLVSLTSGDAFLDETQAAKTKVLYDEVRRKGSAAMNKVTYHGPEDAERISGIKGARALYTFPAYVLWPYKMVMHFLSSAVAAGVNLQTHTPVQGISAAVDGDGYWKLDTPRGPIKAKRIVFATNGYTSGLLPEYRGAIRPSKGTCARMRAKAGESGPAPLSSCAIILPSVSDSYWGIRPDGSYIVGDMGRNWRSNREMWYGNFDDATLIEPAVPSFETWAARNLVGWEGVKMDIENIWSGIMGYTTDNLPHVGRVPGKDGLFICAGFFGHGMPNVLLCARAIAKLLEDGSPLAQSGIPACYETSVERLGDAGKIVAE